MKNKLLIIIPIIIFGLVGIIYKINYDNQEKENIKIDEYNFAQLEKVKQIISNRDFDVKNYYTLKEFNKIYSSDIKPIKNCYYVSNSNGKESYIFGFKLYSNKYKKNYGKDYYAYPKYNMPVHNICGGGKKCDYDMIFGNFILSITNPCRD